MTEEWQVPLMQIHNQSSSCRLYLNTFIHVDLILNSGFPLSRKELLHTYACTGIGCLLTDLTISLLLSMVILNVICKGAFLATVHAIAFVCFPDFATSQHPSMFDKNLVYMEVLGFVAGHSSPLLE